MLFDTIAIHNNGNAFLQIHFYSLLCDGLTLIMIFSVMYCNTIEKHALNVKETFGGMRKISLKLSKYLNRSL